MGMREGGHIGSSGRAMNVEGGPRLGRVRRQWEADQKKGRPEGQPLKS